jgi:hypothetical protein
MSWLFPLYLAGAAAVIVPILLHLRRQPPKDRVAFSSLMFLEETERQPTRRRRLENWLLLLARCLILILLALMFARPFSRDREAGGVEEGESVVVLLDRSASMRRGELWERGVEAVREVVEAAGVSDRVAVGLFDGKVEWVMAGDEGLPEARRGAVAGLAKVTPGWGETDLGRAMVSGLEVLAQWNDGGRKKRRLVVVSDFQEGAKLAELQKVAWPEGVVAERRVIALEEEGNLTLELVSGRTEEEEEGVANAEVVRRVRVSSSRETQQTGFELAWEGSDQGVVVQGFLAPGGRRVLKMPPRKKGDEKPGVLKVTGDAFDFDNRVYVAPEQPREVRVRVAAEEEGALERAASPGYYLKRALLGTAAVRPVLETVAAASWDQVAGGGVVVSAGDGVRLGEAGIAAWRRVLGEGGLGVYVVDGVSAEAELKALTGGLGWRVKEAGEQGDGAYAMLGEVDSKDGLLAPFADARLKDFTKVRFWKHRVVAVEGEGVKVLARFDSGDAAMIAVRQGAGTLLVLASGWHPADSQLALSTKFVPLWFGWLAAAGFSYEEEAALQVGQALPLDFKGEGKVTGPSGQVDVVKAGEALVAREPGVYRVEANGVGKEARWFAVQLPAGEGRVSVMPEERLTELGVNLVNGEQVEGGAVEVTAEARERMDGVETEAKQRLWLWTLVAILFLVVVESLLGAGRGRESAAAG